jgi:hypothetical protein
MGAAKIIVSVKGAPVRNLKSIDVYFNKVRVAISFVYIIVL